MKKYLYITIPLILLSVAFFILPLVFKGETRWGTLSKFLFSNFYFLNSSSDAFAAASRTGLVGWWTMDANDTRATTTLDRSGFNHHGTPVGFYSGQAATSTQGKINQAINFDRTNGYIDLGTFTSLNGATAFTISAWVKPRVLPFAGNYQGIFALGSSAQRSPWIFGNLGGSTVTSQFETTTGGASDCDVTFPLPLRQGEWTLLTLTWNGTQCTAYYNTSPSTPDTTAGSILANTDGNNFIGKIVGFSGFDGAIDDVRIYNRALSAQEIGTLYNSAKVGYETAPSRSSGATASGKLVGWWTMDTGDMSTTGAIMYDKSGQNKNGTVYGTTTSTGRINQARSFNGTSDQIGISITNYSTVHTVSFWAKGNTANKSIIGSTSVNGAGFFSGTAFLYYTSASINASWNYVPNATDWHHYAYSRNGTSINLYIDGIAQGTKTLGANEDLSISTLGSWGGNYKWVGSIDDVRIYNYTLSAQEVSNLYSSAKSSYSSGSSRTGLVGHWTMDVNDMSATGATLYDKSGQNNHGTVTGTTTSTGKIGTARSFNGTSDKISMGDVLDFERNQPFTIAAWYKAAAVSPSAVLPLVSKQGAFANLFKGYDLNIRGDAANDPFEFQMYNEWSSNGLNGRFPRPNDTNWHQVIVTYSGSSALSGVKGYVDGVLQNMTTVADSLTTDGVVNAFNFEIGSWSNSSSYFSGSIDDVRIYNYALTAQQVANLYQSSSKTYMK